MAHDPLSIDEDTPPDFVNELGVKWWKLDIGDKKDGTAFLVDRDGDREYVIVKDGKVIYSTYQLESLLYEFDALKLIRTMS